MILGSIVASRYIETSSILVSKRWYSWYLSRHQSRDANFREFYFSIEEFLPPPRDSTSTRPTLAHLQRWRPPLLLLEHPRHHTTGVSLQACTLHLMLQALSSGGESGEYTQRVTCCMEDTDGNGCWQPLSRHSPSIKCHLTEADSFIVPTVDCTMLIAKLAVRFPAA